MAFTSRIGKIFQCTKGPAQRGSLFFSSIPHIPLSSPQTFSLCLCFVPRFSRLKFRASPRICRSDKFFPDRITVGCQVWIVISVCFRIRLASWSKTKKKKRKNSVCVVLLCVWIREKQKRGKNPYLHCLCSDSLKLQPF